jgi:hypothetical protein
MIAFEQAEGGVDWAVLSEIGQAFGTISALISAVALLGITASLRLQRQQTKVAQFQLVSGMRTDLLNLALEDPRYLAPWGITISHDAQAAKDRAYTSLVFSYVKMAFVVGLLSELELESSARAAFLYPRVRTFWEQARDVYLADATSDRATRFAELMENAYASTVAQELSHDSAINNHTKRYVSMPHIPLRRATWAAAALLCCSAAATILTRRTWRRRHGSPATDLDCPYRHTRTRPQSASPEPRIH